MNVSLLPLQSLGRVDRPGHDGHATFRFDGVPPVAPGYLDFGPLKLCGYEHMQGEASTGYPMHDHANVEVVTVMLRGSLAHRDSLGNEGETRAGEVQVMSAGTGISHEEMPIGDVTAVQIMMEPSERDAPPRCERRSFADDEPDQLVVLASGRPQASTAALPIGQDAAVLRAVLHAERQVRHHLEPGRRAYVLVVRGSVRVEGQPASEGERVLCEGDGALAVDAVTEAEVLVIDLP